MTILQLTIINKLGLHARAAAKFATTANRYESQVRVGVNDRMVDGKSVMSLMLLAANQGTDINLEVEGADEQEAVTALSDLVNNRFEEGE